MGDLTSGDNSRCSGDSDLEPEMGEGMCDSDGFSTEVSNRAQEQQQGTGTGAGGGMEPAVVGYGICYGGEPRRRAGRRVLKNNPDPA